MNVEESPLKDCFVIRDTVFNDDRGYFFESYNQEKFTNATGLQITFVQDNQSHSTKGVLRGLHYQKGKDAQAKLVRVLKGEVLDVVVDLRQSSPTFSKTFSIVLSETNHTQLFIPRGFAHGFIVLSEEVDFFYKCDNFYNKSAEGGIKYNDPQLNIDWKMQPGELIISSKDQELPFLNGCKDLFD